MTRTPEQTRGYIADRTEARRLIQALTEVFDRWLQWCCDV